MSLPARFLAPFALLAALLACLRPAAADEIRLRNGKTVSGEIVGFEDNMFKVKTDFGFLLIEKSKVASIVPSAAKAKPAEKAGAKSGAEKEIAPDKAEKREVSKTDPASSAKPDKKEDKPASSAPPAQTIPMTPDSSSAPVKRVAAPSAPAADLAQTPPPSPSPPNTSPAPQPSPPGESVQGNVYTNFTHGFRFYKPPGWQLIEDANRTWPNAIVAMGTEDRMTMLVAGTEASKEPLEAAAAAIEERMRPGYENYRHLSQKKTTVGGLPAVEILYRGVERERDWSGRLVVVARGKELFTILGITFADSDLIQIQENVISRAIASLNFNVK